MKEPVKNRVARRSRQIEFSQASIQIYEDLKEASSRFDNRWNFKEIIGMDVNAKRMQNIEGFSGAITKNVDDDAFLLSARASSGLGVTYEITDPSIAVIEGNKVTIQKEGVTTITARQAGNYAFEPAQAGITLTVGNDTGTSYPVLDESPAFSLQGNPVVSEARFSFAEAGSNARIVIVDLNGRIVLTENIAEGSTEATVNVGSLSKGVYVVKYTDGNGKQESVKLVK